MIEDKYFECPSQALSSQVTNAFVEQTTALFSLALNCHDAIMSFDKLFMQSYAAKLFFMMDKFGKSTRLCL